MLVQDVMTRNPVCCTPETSVGEIARLMCENACGAIPVVNDQQRRLLLGIVTGRDITCRVLAKGADVDYTPARACMSAGVVTVAPNDSVVSCCQAMQAHRIRRVPVVDASGACCGIVSLDEIAYWAPNQMTASLIRAVMRPVNSVAHPAGR